MTRIMKKPLLLQTISGLTAMLFMTTLQAEPQFARQYKSAYGYPPSCNACHKDGGGSPLNDYGKAFEGVGAGAAAYAKIEGQDSDGDGDTNLAEIKAKANPGDPGSTVKDPGKWLDTSNLIPKSVQAAFPGVKVYKPLDALFTDKEIERAAGLGVTLTEADENTIYVPVKDGKAAGTAIIVPAMHERKPFFLLVATDPKLVITRVEAISTKHVPGAEKSAIYAKLIGKPADAIAADGVGEGTSGVDAAIVSGVQKAGAILAVRLKK